jgi:predicted CoA-substrate-specific enzyme activase
MICAGVDAGSRAIKIVLIDSETQEVAASGAADQGIRQAELAAELLESVAAEAGETPESLGKIVATGYGRNLIQFADKTVTEITCHARGARRLFPDVRTIVEIGGQDSKIIRLDSGGIVQDFAMNDRCAAGTGRFLEVVAERLETGLDDLGEISERSSNPAPISSMCVVFAETEIVGLLASGQLPEDIVAGVQDSIVSRVTAMAGRLMDPPVVFTGGVARLSGMRKSLEERLGRPVLIPPDPRMTGALGAAIIASESL